MARAVRPGGWVRRPGADHLGGPDRWRAALHARARHPDVGALLPGLVRAIGLELVDAWSESPAGAGPGPVHDYLAELTEVDPGDAAIVLPPLVTVLGSTIPA